MQITIWPRTLTSRLLTRTGDRMVETNQIKDSRNTNGTDENR
jgi:hypothetical protein